MFLLSLLMTFGMVGMMAPKASSSRAAKSQAAAAKAKAKAKAKALASDTVEKKRKQSNMVGQLKNASLKLQKVQQGEVKVSEAEMEELEAKQKFWTEYCGLSHFDDKKGEMLEAFSFDKIPGPKRSARRLTKTLLAQMAISPVHWPAFIFLKFFFPHRSWCNLKQINSY